MIEEPVVDDSKSLNLEPEPEPQSWVGGWTAPVLVTGFIIVWCLLIYMLIGDRPREWQYGVLPYIPSASYLTTSRPSPGLLTPKQVEYPSHIRRRQIGR